MEDWIRGYEKAEKEWEAERERAAEQLRKMENRARRSAEEALRLRKRADEERKKSHFQVWSSTVRAQICSISRGVPTSSSSHPQGGHSGGGFQQQNTRRNWSAAVVPVLGTALVLAFLALRVVL